MNNQEIKILIVDDDEDAYIQTTKHLTNIVSYKFNIDWAFSFSKGLQYINENEYDVFLFDYHVDRNENNLQLIKTARYIHKDNPIIVLTAHDSKELDLKTMEAGVSDYIIKSDLSSQILERTIRYGLENRVIFENIRRDQQIFKSGPVTVFKSFAEENWPIEYISPNVIQFGYSSDKFMQGHLSYLDIIHKDDKENLLLIAENLKKKRISHYETDYRIITSEGAVKWVYCFIVAVKDKQCSVNYFDGYILDISKRKENEHKLFNSEKKLKKVQDIAELGYWDYDIENNKVSCSKEIYELLSLPEKPYRIEEFAKLIADENKTEFTEKFDLLLSKKFEFDMDLKLIIKNKFLYINMQAEIELDESERKVVVGSIQNITERKLSQIALVESEEKYRMLIENIQDGVFIIQDNLIQFINGSFINMIGFDYTDIIKKPFHEFVRPEYHDILPFDLENSFNPSELSEFEVKLVHKNSWMDIDVHVSFGKILYKSKASYIGTVKDITEKKKTEDRLKLASNVFESTTEGIMVTDPDGFIQSVNPAFTTITRYFPEDVIGRKPNLLKSGKHDAEFYKDVWQSLKENDHWHGEFWNRRKNGELYPQWTNISVIKDKNSFVSNYVAVFSDITKIKHSEERLNYLAYHDPLTGLANRLLFNDRLGLAVNSGKRQNTKVAVLFFDLDRFKVINDTLGHKIGDLLLQEVANRIKECVRLTDTIARLGGDEFTLVLPDINDIEHVANVAKKILKRLAEVYNLDYHELYITASIGISIYPDDALTPDDLLKKADIAMYHSKERGKNIFHFFTEEMSKLSYDRLKTETQLRHALENQEFILLYQPFIDLNTGNIIGMEALTYWQRDGILTEPGTFIPIAEETGLIISIGQWVLNTACKQNKLWQDQGYEKITVAVNISAKQFQQKDFFYMIKNALDKSGLEAKYLEIEITESIIMHNKEEVVSLLLKLRELGVQIAIDDFGTGYSSLSYLKKFPINKLKIDRSFVKDLVHNQDDAAITKAVISMGKNLNMNVIAEGVETSDQLNFLFENHCDNAQGFHFSKPIPVLQFTELLQKNTTFPLNYPKQN